MRTNLQINAFRAVLRQEDAYPWLNEMSDEEIDACWYAAGELAREALVLRTQRIRLKEKDESLWAQRQE